MLRKIKCLSVNKNDLSELGKSNSKNKNINFQHSASTQIENKSRSKSRLSSLSQQRNCKKIIKMIESPQSSKFKEQAMSDIQNLQQLYSEYTKNKDPLRYLKKSLYTKGIRHSKIDLTCIGAKTDRNNLRKELRYQNQTQIKSVKTKFSFFQQNNQNQSLYQNKVQSRMLQSQNSLQKNTRKIKGIKVLLSSKKPGVKLNEKSNLHFQSRKKNYKFL